MRSGIAPVIVLLLSLVSFPTDASALSACPDRYFPPALDERLFISASDEEALLSQRHFADNCSHLAGDLLQLYFWGGAKTTVDFAAAGGYVEDTKSPSGFSLPTSLLGALLTIDTQNNDSGMATVKRELAAGGLRRDKAVAAIAQYRHVQNNAVSHELMMLSKQSTGQSLYRDWRGPEFQLGQLLVFLSLPVSQTHDNRCTASLLSPSWLITAAHCLYAPAELGVARLQDVRFHPFSVRPGAVSAGIPITEAWIARNFDPHARLSGDLRRYVGADIALLKLATTSAGTPAAFRAADEALIELETSGFPLHTAPGSLWSTRCRAAQAFPGGTQLSAVYALDCAAAEGQSGALLRDGSGHAVGLVSARLTSDHHSSVMGLMFSPPLLADIVRIQRGEGDDAVLFRQLPLPAGH